MRIGAIDQGTTSTRALTHDGNGHLQVVHLVEHRQIYPQSGWVEHDPDELIRNIQACVDAIGSVDAIGIDNQGESCLAWDSVSKAALSPVIVWQDNRTADLIRQLRGQGLESETLARAGLPLTPYFSAAKLAWIIHNIPAASDAMAKGTLRLGTTDAFFLDRLTGHFKTDVSTASRTSLMNLKTREWDPFLCDLFGVPIELLPEIVPTTGDFGALKTANRMIPVTASVVDQQAALYGFGCRKKGDAKFTFGTGAFALMVTGDTIHEASEQGLLPTIAWQLAGEQPVYALDGGIYTASAALNWARSLGLFGEFTNISTFEAPAAIDRGLAFVPALSGLGCPHLEPSARGMWLGLSLDTASGDMVQAILEGVAFRAAQVIDAMSNSAPPSSPLSGPLPVDGGMSRNPYFTQFLADVLERDIRPAEFPELTGFGTAQLAAKSFGSELLNAIPFGTVSPKNSRTNGRTMFDQACQMSRQWNTAASSS